MKYPHIKLVVLILAFVMGKALWARDIFSELMRDSVATFSDASELMYYSVKALVVRQKKADDKLTAAEQQEAQRLLAEKGILLENKNQPIHRSAFARTLIQRFNLSTSFMTDLFRADVLYYRDALRLGLFDDNLPADATLTTRELLRAYLKAESLQNGK